MNILFLTSSCNVNPIQTELKYNIVFLSLENQIFYFVLTVCVLSSFLFLPVGSAHCRCLLLLSWTSCHPLQLLCDMGQSEAMLFGQCFPLNGPSFIFTHGAFPVPEQLYTWLHLELKEQAESLSPAKEQQHCDSYWAVCLLCSCLHSQSKRREYYLVLIK